MKLCVCTIVATILLLVPVLVVKAQTPCGNIVIPTNFYGEGSEEQITPIENCDNPLNADANVSFTTSFTLDGEAVSESKVIEVVSGSTTIDLTFEMSPRSFSSPLEIYRREGQDYILTYVSNTNKTDPTPVSLPPGKYTAAFVYTEPPILNRAAPTIFEKVFAFLLPTTHAYYLSFQEIKIVNFEIAETAPEPTGASSVLFLPGIQASKLYKDGLFTTEDEIWPPGGLNDVGQLAMTNDGTSINNVYTRDVVSSAPGVGDVYAGFLDFLDKEKNVNKTIKDFDTGEYDWRYGVTDIVRNGVQYENEVKSLVEKVETLANDSLSGKVTLITHSNGGLLGKALISELDRIGKSNLIDKFIMIGTPQLGTPKAIGSILHGYDQTDKLGGLILDGAEVREVTNNMPGAYGLLPSERYIEELDVPIVQFGTSTVTLPYRVAFGPEITEFSQYKNFLTGNTGPTRSLDSPLPIPAKANENLLNKAFNDHKNLLDEWEAPGGIEVIEVVGTGLPTMKAVEYREIESGQTCVNVNGITTCTPNKKMKAYAQLSKYGDQTVMQRSAEAYQGSKDKFFLNLKLLGEQQTQSYAHYNLTEIPQLQNLISNILSSSTREGIAYLNRTYTQFDDSYEIEIIDSPVRMVSTDETGNKTGVVIENGVEVIKEEIPNSQYFEFADTKYLIVPSGVRRTTSLYGEDVGQYSLTIAQLRSNDTQTIKHQLKNATVTPTMVATFSNNGSEFSSVKTDLDGNGTIDTETTIDGLQIFYTYSDLRKAIVDTSIPKVPKRVLLELVKAAEQASLQKVKYPIFKSVEALLLKQVNQLLKVYITKKYVTLAEVQNIERIIMGIKK